MLEDFSQTSSIFSSLFLFNQYAAQRALWAIAEKREKPRFGCLEWSDFIDELSALKNAIYVDPSEKKRLLSVIGGVFELGYVAGKNSVDDQKSKELEKGRTRKAEKRDEKLIPYFEQIIASDEKQEAAIIEEHSKLTTNNPKFSKMTIGAFRKKFFDYKRLNTKK